MTGTLFVVATPIGNLQDITLRALETLKQVDLIVAEDTRHTRGLLAHFGISAQLWALHEHNEHQAGNQVMQQLLQGQSVALLSDAGTPGVSDPGQHLVAAAHSATVRVVPVPGACAAVAAFSVAGLSTTRFRFYGFLPTTAQRRREELAHLQFERDAVIFYEAPHRIQESVQDMASILGGERPVVLARELTKMFETIHRCTLMQAIDWLAADSNRQRGEFVLLVSGFAGTPHEVEAAEAQRVLRLLLAELPLSPAVKLAVAITGQKRNLLYPLALAIQGENIR